MGRDFIQNKELLIYKGSDKIEEQEENWKQGNFHGHTNGPLLC